jgi:dihydrofolate synthase/folylpolyglutamate synthase
MTKKKYDQCLEEMFGLHRFGIKLGLDVIRHILDHLKNPEKATVDNPRPRRCSL